MIRRDNHLNQLRHLQDKKLIKVITGVQKISKKPPFRGLTEELVLSGKIKI